SNIISYISLSLWFFIHPTTRSADFSRATNPPIIPNRSKFLIPASKLVKEPPSPITMAIDRIVQFVLRGAQLVFAAIVAGITGAYLHATQNTSSWDNGRYIYTIVVASLSLLFALIWLLPFSGSFIHWPMDIFLSILWFVAFGLLVNLVGDGCGPIFDWSNVSPRGDACGRNKANIAFCFLSAIVWLASALVGLFWVRRRTAVADSRPAHTGRRRWYRSSRV
ncbi:hypothetical protein CPAR01_06683, partial [Colletotrichum paranaense]